MLLVFVLASVFASVLPPTGYEAAAASVPARHWALVRSVHVDRDSGGQARRSSMSVHLTPYRSDGQLWHELGHIVRWSDPSLASDWDRQFWSGGKVRGIPPSRYARTEPDEDFAESYEEMLEHGCLEDPDRTRFMMERVFRPGELPACETIGSSWP